MKGVCTKPRPFNGKKIQRLIGGLANLVFPIFFLSKVQGILATLSLGYSGKWSPILITLLQCSLKRTPLACVG